MTIFIIDEQNSNKQKKAIYYCFDSFTTTWFVVVVVVHAYAMLFIRIDGEREPHARFFAAAVKRPSHALPASVVPIDRIDLAVDPLERILVDFVLVGRRRVQSFCGARLTFARVFAFELIILVVVVQADESVAAATLIAPNARYVPIVIMAADVDAKNVAIFVARQRVWRQLEAVRTNVFIAEDAL